MAEAGRLAERAVLIDPQDAKALTIAGHVRASLHHRLREATALHDRALSLNPNLPMAWSMSSLVHAYLGDLDEAERRAQRYRKLAPLGPTIFAIDTSLIVAPLLRRDFEAASVAGRTATEMHPGFAPAYKAYLAALGHMGHVSEADRVRARLLAIEPGFTLRRFNESSPFARAQDRDAFVTGLRLAGIDE
jgi:tetratricopeptide (TPR) repeat protein